jgi:hypothetical protein
MEERCEKPRWAQASAPLVRSRAQLGPGGSLASERSGEFVQSLAFRRHREGIFRRTYEAESGRQALIARS